MLEKEEEEVHRRILLWAVLLFITHVYLTSVLCILWFYFTVCLTEMTKAISSLVYSKKRITKIVISSLKLFFLLLVELLFLHGPTL